jgi:hypothetical protein
LSPIEKIGNLFSAIVTTVNSPPKDQIPTEYNEEQTQRVIRKQHGISGEGRDKTIYDFPYTAAVARILKDLHFPANKEDIIEYTEQKRSTMPWPDDTRLSNLL